MRDDELVRRLAAGDWVTDDRTQLVPSLRRVLELVRLRRRRRRFAAVGGAGLACAGLIALFALLPEPSGTGTAPPAAPSSTATDPPTVESCPNRSVVLSLGSAEGGGGLRQPVEIANVGSSRCRIAVPTLTLLPDDGPPSLVRGPNMQAITIDPQTAVSLMIDTATLCGGGPGPWLVRDVRVAFGDGWTYVLHGARLASGCNPAPRVTDVSEHPAAMTTTAQPPGMADLVPCRPAGLRVSHGAVGVAAGSSGSDIILANEGVDPCRLPGGIRLALVTPDGDLPVEPAPAMRSPHVLLPGQSARFGVFNVSICGPAQTISPYTDAVRIRFPGGWEHVVAGAKEPYGCGQPVVVEFRIV